MGKVVKEFRDFLVRGNIVDLAVAFVAGAAFAALITAVTAGLVTPIVGIVLNVLGANGGFATIRLLAKDPDGWHVFTTSAGDTGILLGSILNAAITFVLTMAALFFVIVKPVTALTARMKAPVADDAPPKRECPFCLTSIPAKASRCPACTSEVTATA